MAKSILIVEDDNNIADLLRLYLEKEGYAVTQAYDGEVAFEAFEREMLDEALKAHRGNAAAAARSLNLTIRIIHYKIRKLGLDPAAYR